MDWTCQHQNIRYFGVVRYFLDHSFTTFFLSLLHGHSMYLISYGTDTTSMVHRCESHSSFFREHYRVPWLLTYLLFYCTYNSFTLPFQGRTLNTHAAEANLHRFPLPQAPGWGAIQFLTTISKCKVARNFRPDFRFQRINIARDLPQRPVSKPD